MEIILEQSKRILLIGWIRCSLHASIIPRTELCETKSCGYRKLDDLNQSTS